MLTFLFTFLIESLALVAGSRLIFTYICTEPDYLLILAICLPAVVISKLKTKKKILHFLAISLYLLILSYLFYTIMEDNLRLIAYFLTFAYVVLSLLSLSTSKWFGCIFLLLPMLLAIYYQIIYIRQFVLLALVSLCVYLFSQALENNKFSFKRFGIVLLIVLVSALTLFPLSAFLDKDISPIRTFLENNNGSKKYGYVASYEEKEAKVYCNYHFAYLRKTSYGKYDKGKLYNNTISTFFDNANYLDFAHLDQNMYTYKIVTTDPSIKLLTPYGLLKRDDTYKGIRDESYQFTSKIPSTYSVGFTPFAKISVNENLSDKYNEYIEYVKEEYTEVPEYMESVLEEYFFKEYGINTDDESTFNLVQSLYQVLNNNFILYEENRNISDYKDRVETFLTKNKYGDYNDFNITLMLLFRHCGIPCRLVEGYILNNWNNNVASYNTDELRTWIELYASNYGWVPVDAVFGEPKWMWPTYIPEIDIEGLLSTIDSDKLDLVLARISKPEDFISLSREYNQEVIEMDIDFDFDLPEGNSEDFPSVSAAEEPKSFNPVLLLIAVCVLLAIYIFVRIKRPSRIRTPEDVIYDKYNILADFDFVSKETEELVLRVRFSNHPLTKEDLEYMDNQISKLQIKIKEEYSLLRRLKVRIKYGLKVL